MKGEKQQKQLKRQKLLPEGLKKSCFEGEKATKMYEKAEIVAGVPEKKLF